MRYYYLLFTKPYCTVHIAVNANGPSIKDNTSWVARKYRAEYLFSYNDENITFIYIKFRNTNLLTLYNNIFF